MIDALLNFDFIRYSLISGLLIGFIAPLIGAFIVVRRLSLIADALSHVTLGGISFGMFLLTIIPVFSVINPMWFGILFAVLDQIFVILTCLFLIYTVVFYFFYLHQHMEFLIFWEYF